MGDPLFTRMLGRTAVLGSYLVVLAFTGRPATIAVLLAGALVLVWAAPLLLATNRRRTAPARRRLVVEPEEAGPAT